ncbi:hypothetical protein [Teichococcus oryzae]|uniref:DUF91 domain-containing protein n=1 Tax=Teichococcus oryzae TaxID=1608942 RepID=A0A5B2T9B4_9PROT|nr:hypothetical protein [Pseudoroseomonas oryzae]KAA2211211.1 hypothetical protein F0Q34_21270 [Pseudoroseomonas oryzae]
MAKTLALADFVLEEVPGAGLLVRQGGRQYLARGWSLTAEVEQVLQTLCAHGFTCLIRFEQRSGRAVHPRGAAAEYLGFSRTPEERWLLVLDQFSGRPGVTQVTVEKSYHTVLRQHGLPVIWETAGGKNLFLPVRFLDAFLGTLDEATLAAVAEGQRRENTTAAQLRRSGIVSEAQLQHVLVEQILAQEHGDLFGNVRRVQVHPVWLRAADGVFLRAGRDIPDLVVESANRAFVLELKKAVIGRAEIHQLHRYLANPAIARLAGSRPITGLLIGDRVDPGIGPEDLRPLGNHTAAVSILRYRFEDAVVLEPWCPPADPRRRSSL